jgi:hypothetical protein
MMRDPARIPQILEQLRRTWESEPDLRLGQLIVIATKPSEACPEVFYIEDEKLLQGLEAYAATLKDKEQ